MKRIRYVDGALDALDLAILEILSRDARTAMTELAQRIGLSPPSATERVRRLEEAGVIEGYSVRLNAEALGLSVGAYLRVRPMPGELDRVAGLLAAMTEVTACDRVTGDDCFIAKVHVPAIADLENLINRLLRYATTNTSIIVSTPVDQRMPMLGHPARQDADEVSSSGAATTPRRVAVGRAKPASGERPTRLHGGEGRGREPRRR
jgi:Lrp/AsnC family transcriptional regulator, leucine-responsive regulatory protein